jgi:tRNA pseudouridine13 synthase
MLTLSKTDGVGGTIKGSPEDFMVEEIALNGTVLEVGKTYTGDVLGLPEASSEAEFTVFVMQKTDWNTIQALKTLARKLRRGIKSVGFAGTKDRTSISTQLCSMYGIRPEEIMGVHVKDILINGAWSSDTEVKLGELSGNRFIVTIAGSHDIENMEKIDRELNGIFPNYFGGQRFGLRNNNVDIGVAMIKADFKSAVSRFLTDTNNERNEDAVAARKRLAEEQDYRKALEYFPGYLKYERQLLAQLSMHPTDFANALRKLPRSLALMFVHSVESYIFNKEVERMIKEGAAAPGMYGNIVGYDNEINDTEKAMLDELGLTQEMFRVKSMPELNCKGGKRLLFAPYTDFSYEKVGENIRVRFSLESGSYATVLLNEFTKMENEKG